MNKENVTTEQIGEHIIDRSMDVYRLLKKYADKHGIKIYNATVAEIWKSSLVSNWKMY